MKAIEVTAYSMAERFVGVKEGPGQANNPQVVAMLHLDAGNVWSDDVPWCSAFVNYVCWLLRITRSKSLAARSWLCVGQPVQMKDAQVGFDVVVMWRGEGKQPGPEVLDAPGHVGFFGGWETDDFSVVNVLGGNQGDQVSIAKFPATRILGIRRLA